MRPVKFLFIIAIFFFVAKASSQTVEDLSKNEKTFEIKDGTLINVSTDKTVLKLVENAIKDADGNTLYTIAKGVLKNTSKKSLYKYADGIVSDLSSGKSLYMVTEGGVIKSWSMGVGVYRIIGGFGTGELFMILLGTGLL